VSVKTTATPCWPDRRDSGGGTRLYFGRPASPLPARRWSRPRPSNTLESLAELDGKNPTNRQLNVQTWKTAEGSKVLFVEAHELPMFDLRMTFAAGSSQDGNTPGLALLTNAMLNEGVPAKMSAPLPRVLKAWGRSSAMAPTATWPWPRCAA
jgi:hypothetical protein